MKADIVFLHTSPVHIETFEQLVRQEDPATTTRHVVVEQLLAAAQTASTDDPALVARIHRAMIDAVGDGASVVVCTCSTIGGAAERVPTGARFRAMRVDRPMADRAVRSGPRILLVAALESTLAPTSRLLHESAVAFGRDIDVHPLLVDAAGAADVVVLAQASMASASELLTDLGVPVLSSPRLGVRAAIDATRRRG
jgi:hypothetical protein